MKKINVRFEEDASLEDINVLIKASERDSDINDLIAKITGADPDTIAVTGGDGTVDVVKANDIVLLSVNGKQVSVITESARYTVHQPLNSIEPRLDNSRFVRISRYEIVNLSKVVKYDFTLGGTLRIELVGGMETWASRRCIPQIRRRLMGKE